MKLVWWMLVGSALSSLGITALFGAQIAPEVWLGMAAPLLAASGTWMAVERARRRHPEVVTALLIKGLLGKMVFFGAYVVAVVRAGIVRPFPFVISFTCYFLALHIIEAVCLHRLFARSRASLSVYK
jgi:hypothetical protein